MTVAIPTADSARDVLATPHLRRVRAVQRPSHPRTSATPGPIEQATALRDSLRAAASAANQLLRSIKHQKKQARLVTSTLESLKQLQRVAS